MAEIRIEAKPVMGDYGHLYLVYVDDNNNEFVIRGGPENDSLNFGHIVVESGVPIEDSEDKRPIENRNDFGSKVLDLGGRDAQSVWSNMIESSKLIHDAEIDYSVFFGSQNSNSVISAVLRDVDIDVKEVLPDIKGIEHYPAIDNLLTVHYLGADADRAQNNLEAFFERQNQLTDQQIQEQEERIEQRNDIDQSQYQQRDDIIQEYGDDGDSGGDSGGDGGGD